MIFESILKWKTVLIFWGRNSATLPHSAITKSSHTHTKKKKRWEAVKIIEMQSHISSVDILIFLASLRYGDETGNMTPKVCFCTLQSTFNQWKCVYFLVDLCHWWLQIHRGVNTCMHLHACTHMHTRTPTYTWSPLINTLVCIIRNFSLAWYSDKRTWQSYPSVNKCFSTGAGNMSKPQKEEQCCYSSESSFWG